MRRTLYLFGLMMLDLIISVAMAIVYWMPVWLMWNWLAPNLFNLPTASIWEAFGLSLCFAYFSNKYTEQQREDMVETWYELG